MTSTTGRYPRTFNRRGEAKRDAFLDALEAFLENTPWREVTPIQVARSIKASPASFYCYWPTLDEAAWDLCMRFRERRKRLPRHLLLIYRLLEWERDEIAKEAEVR